MKLRIRRAATAAWLAAFVLLVVGAAQAQFPFPPDPSLCDSSGLPALCTPLPNEITGGAGSCGGLKWKYASTSFCTTDPTVLASPNELFGVSGASVDISWRVETGRSDVVIAVLDSGMKWLDVGAMTDLRSKFYLNRGELPLPSGPCTPPPGDPYDCNADGAFNMPDYDGDPAVTDLNGTGVTDPQDLIMVFSDSVDDDGDGYVDNISGWDFFEYDNDPFDEVDYGHGTGEARDSAAVVNNGGDAGACPNCLSMTIRVGDSFVADVQAFAQAVVFAVDTGADVIQEALGTLNNTVAGQQAVTYAYENGIPVMASAADEDAWHHNYPSNYVHTIVVNSVTDFDIEGFSPNPDSWLYINGCTNFGGNMALAVPSSSCSSEATGRSSGMAGLLVSAGRNAADASTISSPLTANEVRQVFISSADDVYIANRAVTFPDTVRYASKPGFDQFTGYGRINSRSALDEVLAGDIPPEAEIDEPVWFQPLYPNRDGSFDVVGRVAADRASGYTYRVQIAYGVQPEEADYVDVVPFGATQTAAIDGLLATVSPAQVPTPTPDQIARRNAEQPDLQSDYDEFTYTLRVQVIDQPGGLVGQDRRTIFIHDDPDLKAGFPMQVGDGASSPAIADLDGDGAGDIVFGTADGKVFAKRGNGTNLAGWPVLTDPIPIHTGSAGFSGGAVEAPRGSVLASVAIGDIDGDDLLDVVAADLEGKVYAWSHQGVLKGGFPVTVDFTFSAHAVRNKANTVDRAIVGSPALADFDGDGGLDIVVAGHDRHVYVWDGFGVPRAGFPVLVVDDSRMASIDPINHKVVPLAGAFQGSKINTSPAIGDLDGNGTLDIVVGTNEAYDETPNYALTSATSQAISQSGFTDVANSRVYAIQSDGNDNPGGRFLPGWPVGIGLLTAELLPVVGEGTNASPALADVDGDGTLEVGVFSIAGPAYLLNHDGTSFYGNGGNGGYNVMATEGGSSTSPDTPSLPALGEGAFGDLFGAAELNFAAPAAGLGRLLAVLLPGQQVHADDHVTAWQASTGQYVPGFPKHMEDLPFLTGPSIADVGGTPLPEIVAASAGYFVHAYDGTGVEPLGWPKFTGGWHVANPAVGDVDGDGLNEVVALVREGNLFVWDTTAPAGAEEWPMKRHDLRNTGNYEEPQGRVSSSVVLGTIQTRRMKIVLRGSGQDKLSLTGFGVLSSDGDGVFDPAADGLSFAVDDDVFTLTAGAFVNKKDRVWKYKDNTGAGSDPDGITQVRISIRKKDGRRRIKVKGTVLDLSSFSGSDDRVVDVSMSSAEDQLADNVRLRRRSNGSLKGPK